MNEAIKVKYFRKALLDWFVDNKRDFPWREPGTDNFRIIISEVLLQRTKAETVAKYYKTFFDKYPGWTELTGADQDDLETILHPLGLYKHRAKRLLKIAQDYKSRQGKLPSNKDELAESSLATLYISGAYELFVLNRRSALVDVNMSRVLRRFFEPGEFRDVRNDRFVIDMAASVVNVKKCKELNWAILDFAALVCKAGKPACNECILRTKCKYFLHVTNF